MRSLFFVAAIIVLHCLSASGSEGVNVESPIVTLVPTRERLRQACASAAAFDACTHFVAFRLEGTCGSDGRTWHIDARASFRPYILLENLRSLSHEHEHVNDVRRSVTMLIARLRALELPSEEACRQRVLAEKEAFRDHLRAFAEASNLQRHPLLRARR